MTVFIKIYSADDQQTIASEVGQLETLGYKVELTEPDKVVLHDQIHGNDCSHNNAVVIKATS